MSSGCCHKVIIMDQPFGTLFLDWMLLMAFVWWHVAEAQKSRDEATQEAARRLGTSGQSTGAVSTSAYGDETAVGLSNIAKIDPSFNVGMFLAGVGFVYEPIVIAFTAGKRNVLSTYLSPEVLSDFDREIRIREGRGERLSIEFIKVGQPDIIEAFAADRWVQITVRCESKLIKSAYREDALSGAIAPSIIDTVDVWTFGKNVDERDEDWKLVATRQERSDDVEPDGVALGSRCNSPSNPRISC